MTLFGDEALFSQQGTVCHTWGPIGERINMLSHPGRTSVGVFGAVTVDHENPKFHFRFEEERFNTETFVPFLEHLLDYYVGRKIYLILDGAPYHKSAVKWAADNYPDHIEIHLLPPYSPQLDPTETIWRITKKTATHNRYFPEIAEMLRTIRRRFNRFQGNPASLRGVVEAW